MRLFWVFILGSLLSLFGATHAFAQAPIATDSTPLLVQATPVLGPNASIFGSWIGCVIHLENPTEQSLSGTLQLIAAHPWQKGQEPLYTRAPFAVAAGERVTLQLPTHGYGSGPADLRVEAVDEAGNLLGQAEVALLAGAQSPLVLDVHVPSRLIPMLRGQAAIATGPHQKQQLVVTSPQIEASTGEPVLPVRSAGYASANLVVMPTEILTGLSGAPLEALGNWVLAGGSLALDVSRPEDLRSDALRALLGGAAAPAAVPPSLLGDAIFVLPPDPGRGPSPPGGGPSSGALGSSVQRAAPGAELAALLTGYSGGNLKPSPWGATASYGLGEVHLLAFATAREPFVSADWTRIKLLGLVQHAYRHSRIAAFPHAAARLSESDLSALRRKLDPNESTRWTIVVSAILLLIYAVLAGPLNFYLAARRGKPLRALLHLPLWSAAAMLLIVAVGWAGKGVEGRARRLSVVEAGAGMKRAAVTRFRAFFASSADTLTVRAGARGAVLDIANDEDGTGRQLVVDRDGARLEQFRTKPWETMIVREDAFVDLAGGVTIAPSKSGPSDAIIHNRLERDLVAVLIRLPKGPVVAFPRIKSGQTVRVSQAPKTLTSFVPSGTGHSIKALYAHQFSEELNGYAEDSGNVWEALSTAARYAVWWPEVPVLLAQVDGGEGRTSDSGLKVEIDRVLLRVVGYGGIP